MSSLPYAVILPVSDNSDCDRVGIIISDIRCFKQDRTHPDRCVVFMHDPKVFHFINLTVEQVRDEINATLDGLEE